MGAICTCDGRFRQGGLMISDEADTWLCLTCLGRIPREGSAS